MILYSRRAGQWRDNHQRILIHGTIGSIEPLMAKSGSRRFFAMARGSFPPMSRSRCLPASRSSGVRRAINSLMFASVSGECRKRQRATFAYTALAPTNIIPIRNDNRAPEPMRSAQRIAHVIGCFTKPPAMITPSVWNLFRATSGHTTCELKDSPSNQPLVIPILNNASSTPAA